MFLCNFDSGVSFSGKQFRGNYFFRDLFFPDREKKNTKIAKIRTRKSLVPHGMYKVSCGRISVWEALTALGIRILTEVCSLAKCHLIPYTFVTWENNLLFRRDNCVV